MCDSRDFAPTNGLVSKDELLGNVMDFWVKTLQERFIQESKKGLFRYQIAMTHVDKKFLTELTSKFEGVVYTHKVFQDGTWLIRFRWN